MSRRRVIPFDGVEQGHFRLILQRGTTWTNDKDKDNDKKTMRKTETFREYLQIMIHTLLTFKTFDKSDQETWPDQKRQ